MANPIKAASRAIKVGMKAEAKQGERELAKALKSTAKQARKAAQPAITSFVAEGDAYVSRGGKYLRSIGGTGKYTNISEALFNRAKDVAEAAKPVEKLKDEATGKISSLRGKMDNLGTRASAKLGVSKNIGNAIAGGAVGGAGGAIVGGTIAAVDGNDNTTVMGGALGGAFLGGAAGGLYGGMMGFDEVAKKIAKGPAVQSADENALNVAEQVANNPVINSEHDYLLRRISEEISAGKSMSSDTIDNLSSVMNTMSTKEQNVFMNNSVLPIIFGDASDEAKSAMTEMMDLSLSDYWGAIVNDDAGEETLNAFKQHLRKNKDKIEAIEERIESNPKLSEEIYDVLSRFGKMEII